MAHIMRDYVYARSLIRSPRVRHASDQLWHHLDGYFDVSLTGKVEKQKTSTKASTRIDSNWIRCGDSSW